MERKVLCLLVILMNVWSANVAFGQFYDDEDQIMFYRSIYESSNSCYTFNFDGNRATDFDEIENGIASRVLGVERILNNNINYFEGQVFNVTYNIKYREDLSNKNWVVYSRYSTGYYGSSWTSYWFFSKDRKTMIYKESSSNYEHKYKLVDKYDFIDKGRKRSNINNETIYE